MDVATRFHTRARAGSNFDRDGNFIVNNVNASAPASAVGGESDTTAVRRKFQRTTTDPVIPAPLDNAQFRKPSIPASAARNAQVGLEHRPSLNQQHQRRRSTLQRENTRVPSGPREFSSVGKQRKASTASTAASIADSTNNVRSFLPQSDSQSFFYDSAMSTSLGHINFSNPTDRQKEFDQSPTNSTPLMEGGEGWLPDINFDDFQTGIRNTSVNNYGANGSPRLDDFDVWESERSTDLQGYPVTRTNGLTARADRIMQTQREDITRAGSLRQRVAAGKVSLPHQQRSNVADPIAQKPRDESWRSRRQSSITQSTTAPLLQVGATREPRKSIGPGLVTNTSKDNALLPNASATGIADGGLKPSSMVRNGSLSSGSRRKTVQPAASAGAEIPRLSTLGATTQSRQNKVKSLQPPPRDQQDLLTSPSSAKMSSKNSSNRSNTPSSSGNRRQSIAQNRAPSGLGARTISPTDARRLKRLSTMQPPPMPAATHFSSKATPTPQEEISNPLNALQVEHVQLPELPRFAQPSPSMIPRRTSNRTPSSARASPDIRPGGVTLSSKSSYSSLLNASMSGSSSRLPTPKPRNGVQSGSSLGQYREHGDGQDSFSSYATTLEAVPPVPAIPKAWGSPLDLEVEPPFFSNVFKSSQSRGSDFGASRQVDGPSVPTPWTSQTPRGSLDIPLETPKKHSMDFPTTRPVVGDYRAAVPPPSAPPTQYARPQPDPNGRKNANLQPLRLPPLNLMPINTKASQASAYPGLPRPSQEVDSRDDYATFQTPEPKRVAKTPSTPMTASKATFFRRQEEAIKALRSSSSHYALRDVLGMDENGNMLTKYWDDSEPETSGVPITTAKARNAITPFSSGSLPKGSGEYARLRARPSGEYLEDENDSAHAQNVLTKPHATRVRPQRGATVTSLKSSTSVEAPISLDSPAVDASSLSDAKRDSEKKEQSIRRKLSLGWKRSSSKTANHADNKSSPPQEGASSGERERRVLKKHQSSDVMPPPKLPASANATWTGELPSLPSATRPSFDGVVRRKSQVPTSISTTSITSGSEADKPGTTGKTRSQHTEQPTPVNPPNTARASSWGALGSAFRSNPNKAPAVTVAKHRLTPSTISAIVKDKDDLAADDEMAKLSRKRKDVDSAARETEELKKRAVAKSPVTAEHIMHDRSLTGGAALNVFERGEIVDYEQDGIYFTGTKAARKIVGSLTASPQPPAASAAGDKSAAGSAAAATTNFGYDDERGDYNIVLGDHLCYRYEVVDVLGKGSFGQVVRCVDHKDGGIVAVKVIRNKKRFHQQALVEVGILGKLRDWDPDGANATLSITSSFYFRSHLCIVTPCLSINLYEFIRAHNFTGFTLPLIRRFARQLLACLTLLQTKRIIHCDLKPENILLCEARKADVRVIDFGSSCREEEKVYTYIQSRFYRSPEVILGSSYGLGIDMWSLGCILAELWTGYPIFPGENEQEQLACIMEIFGPPDRHLVERCTRKKLFFDSVGKPRVTVSSKGRRRRPSSKTLQQALKTEDEAFIDFISRCLRWDPERRLKPNDAVGHPFITNSPFNQRPGIPDEARRAAKVRATAAVPATNGQTAASPVKRSVATSGNAFAQQQQQQVTAATPAKDRMTRGGALPDTPQTAVRNATHSSHIHTQATSNASPSKNAVIPGNPNRRHSTVTTAGAAAMAGTKRASNGIVVGGPSGAASSSAVPTLGTLPTSLPQQHQRPSVGNLAQMAARESMGIAGNPPSASASARWRG